MTAFIKRHPTVVMILRRLIVVGLYISYLIYACIHDFEAARFLVIVTGLALLIYIYVLVRDNAGEVVNEKLFVPLMVIISSKADAFKW